MTDIVLFSGIGSRYTNGDCDLFDRYPALTEVANDILGYSVRDWFLDERRSTFFDGPRRQSEIFVLNAMKYRTLCEDGLIPDLVMGHDLGEYNALEAADVLDFETGLRLVRLREECTEGVSGAMTVSLGLTTDEILGVLHNFGLHDVALASLNTAYQTVLSGHSGDIRTAEKVLFEAGAYDVRRIAVGRPFHSPLMAESALAFSEAITGTNFDGPRIPVIANCTARPYEHARTAENLTCHIHQPVRWYESITWALEHCVDAVHTVVGDERMLGRMLRQIASEPVRQYGT
jgi:trans-AT polyketide synthase/acyltransferase/oxidoreductase domain-containing protein